MSQSERKQLIAEYKTRTAVGAVYAIRNKKTGKVFIQSTQDLTGARNRFAFAQNTGAGLPRKVHEEWREVGPENFEFVILEELTQGDTQTAKEFAQDMKTLKDIWLEKTDPAHLY